VTTPEPPDPRPALPLHVAAAIAGAHYGVEAAAYVELTPCQFGWVARLPEPPAGPPGPIGRPVLAIGPGLGEVRHYPSAPTDQVANAHEGWLAARRRHVDTNGPASFS